MKINVAGLSIGGGRKENFFFALLEFFPDSKRWFLTSLHQVKESLGKDSDEVLQKWTHDYELKELILDFPLTLPPCHTCKLLCPGIKKCAEASVSHIRQVMSTILKQDREHYDRGIKAYEQSRVDNKILDLKKDILKKTSDEHLLSKSFKRKLKKGFLPYWNRPLDVWVWQNYYDQLLELFEISFDSFGPISPMLLFKFEYLKRHFSPELKLFESQASFCLIELLRSKIVSQKNLMDLQKFDLGAGARLEIVKKMEKSLGIFIYEHDLDLIIRNENAFDSFLLAVVGRQYVQKKIKIIPKEYGSAPFLIPDFV